MKKLIMIFIMGLFFTGCVTSNAQKGAVIGGLGGMAGSARVTEKQPILLVRVVRVVQWMDILLKTSLTKITKKSIIKIDM